MKTNTTKAMLLATSLGVLASQFAGATLIFGFYDFDGTSNSESPDLSYGGMSTTVTKAQSSADLNGTTDGFYGNDYLGTPPVTVPNANGYLVLDNTIDTVFTVTNNTGYDWILEQLHFDVLTNGATNSTRQLTVGMSVENTSPDDILFGPTTIGYNAAVSMDYRDFDAILNDVLPPAIPGVALAPGQVFRLFFKQNGTNANRILLDNIALEGTMTVIPEPGSLLALGCVLTSGLALRSRRRRPTQSA